jgi:hypothetical protein
MSKDDEGRDSQSDGLDALASGLEANESEEGDDELDLASLAAVVGARAPSSAGEQAAPAQAEKLVLAGMPASPLVPPAREMTAPAAAPLAPAAGQRGWLVPTLVAFAIAVGAMGYVLGRSSRPEELDSAARVPAEPLHQAEPRPTPAPVAAGPALPAPAAPPAAAPAAAPAQPAASSPVLPSEPARPQAPVAAPRAARAGGAAALAAAPVAREQGEPSEVAAAVAEPAADKPSEAPAVLAKTEPSPSRSVDDLLDEALAPGARPSTATTQAATTLPEAPSREEVTEAMAVLLPAIRGCAMGQTGLATAGIVVRGDGRVASVELSGAPFEGTASGRCMEGVLRRARFARFRQPTFRVRFPFAIQ